MNIKKILVGASAAAIMFSSLAGAAFAGSGNAQDHPAALYTVHLLT